MTRYHGTSSGNIAFTAEEETARDIKEQAWRDGGHFDKDIEILRDKRNWLLAQTDFYALSDVTMSEAMTNYRQALRDLPSGLSTVDEVKAVTYPTKP